MLGWAEMAAALGVALGVFTQVAALVLMLVVLAPAAVASSSSEPFRYYRYHRAMDAPFARPYIGLIGLRQRSELASLRSAIEFRCPLRFA
jgi:uncharacterized membrane protein YphA (DoxX/SURF4 family)